MGVHRDFELPGAVARALRASYADATKLALAQHVVVFEPGVGEF